MQEPQIQEREAQPYLGIRCAVTAGVPAAVDPAFPKLFGWLGEHGVEPAGPVLIRVREIGAEGEPLDLDVGVPVAEAMDGDDLVLADELPAGRYLSVLHVGPYRHETEADLNVTRGELVDWARERELTISRPGGGGRILPAAVEHFRVGPDSEPDYSKWETEITYLIVED